MLELRAHKEKASGALASAQQQIVDLTCALTAARGASHKSEALLNQEVSSITQYPVPLLLL